MLFYCIACGALAQTYNVTFKVNMSEVTETFTTPEVNGTFNGWCGGCAAMSDPEGDNIWEITIALDAGSYEYKYAYDTWAGQETLIEGSPCTVTSFGFTNRTLEVSDDIELDIVCWGSCDDCDGIVLAQMDLPVTFEDPTVEYGLIGFGGADASTIEADPTDSSNTVAKVIKSATAELWAGTTITNLAGEGFATPIPFTETDTKMTVRVWSPDSAIQVRFKVEDHLDPTKSVETEATTTVSGAWETLTFDFANEAAGTAELNLDYSYDKASIFFNFGVTGAVAGEKTYYFDDVMFGEGGALDVYNVTFVVDMSTVTDAYTTPEVNGTFNGWCGGCNPLSDPDGDNVWETTLMLEAGTYQYKFAYDAWAGSETLIEGAPCTITDGGFTNRVIDVTGDIVLDEVCYGSCSSCSSVVTSDITFIVDMSEVTDVFTTPEVNGTFNGWCGGCAPMSDANGDNIWELTIPLEDGSYEYKFAYDTWAGSETLLEGSPCTVTAFGFTNRVLVVDGAAVLDTVCWASCNSCEATTPTHAVVFQVDMNEVTETFSTPEVNGTFNGWCGGCAPMSDADGDNIWELTILLMEGTYEYKFAYDSWAGQESLTEGDPCTSTIDGFTNRTITVTEDATLEEVCWGSCAACDVAIENIPEANITIYPQPAAEFAYVTFDGNIAGSSIATITDITGRSVSQVAIEQKNTLIHLEGLSAGIYQITIVQNNQIIYTGSLSVQ
jgi:hypothetical protein